MSHLMVLLTAPSHVDVFFECQMLNVKLTDVYYSHHLPNIQKFFGHIPFIDIETINTLKYRKTRGHDGISNEHLTYSSSTSLVHISLLFNACLRYNFVSNDYCFGVILPPLKNKHGDSSKLDICIVALLCHVLSLNYLKVLYHLSDYWLY